MKDIELNESTLSKIDLLLEGLIEEKNLIVNGNPQTPTQKFNRIVGSKMIHRDAREIKRRTTSTKDKGMLGGTGARDRMNQSINVRKGIEQPPHFIGAK